MVDIFKALAEESRLRILALLINQELCVCEIESTLNMTQSNVSRHLNMLKKCGVVNSRKDAQWAYYSISPEFKQKHSALWQYLLKHLPELSTYRADQEACGKCKEKKLCLCCQSERSYKDE